MKKKDGIYLLFLVVFGALCTTGIFEAVIVMNRFFRDTIEGIGPQRTDAVFLFIGLQALQVVLFFIPGEFTQALGGYAFGAVNGTLLCIVGTMLGASIQFGISKALSSKLLDGWLKRRKLMKMQRALATNKGKVALFVMYLLPGFPKDLLGYIAGLSGIQFVNFLVISTTARVPGILLSNLFGTHLFRENYLLLGYMIAGIALVVWLSLRYRERLLDYFK